MATSWENTSIKRIRQKRRLLMKSQTTAKDQDMMTLQTRNGIVSFQLMLTKALADTAKIRPEVMKEKDLVTREKN